MSERGDDRTPAEPDLPVELSAADGQAGSGASPAEAVGGRHAGLLARTGAIDALAHQDFRTFWIGAFVSNVGSWMQNVAQGWLVLTLTDSAFMLGLVGFVSTIPMLVLLLVGGVFADRLDRRRLLIWTQAGMMASAAGLALLTALGVVAVWHILVLSFLAGVGMSLAGPAYQAFVHDLVGRRDLQNAIALNSAQFNLSRVVGPSLAGVAVGAIGLAGCFGLNAVSYLAAIGALAIVRGAQRPTGRGGPLWKSMLEGTAYVRRRPRVQALLLLTAGISVLALPYTTLLPIVARDSLGLDAAGLGYLMAVGGVGGVGRARVHAGRGLFVRRGLYILGCGIACGLGSLGLGLARTPVAAGAALMVIGFSATSAFGMVNTILQELVDDAMRGRVLSMYGLAFLGTFPIGNLLAGTLAAGLGASFTLALTGSLLAALTILVAITRPRLREIR